MKQYITVYDSLKVKSAIIQLASYVMKIIEQQGAENCILITVLNGGSYLTHKILDKLGQDMLANLQVENIKVSSYHGQERGNLGFDYIPDIDCTDKTLIIIDDICDTGTTTNTLYKYFKNQGATQIKFFTLVARDSRKLDNNIELTYGIEDKTGAFFVGCGMDENGKSRYINCLVTKLK